jgi:hypothetical protein
VTAALLLDSLTLKPPEGAGLLSVTVHASVPDPVIATLLQESAFAIAVGLVKGDVTLFATSI